MPSTYLPSRDDDLGRWLGNFAAKIAAAPGTYGLSGADAAEITVAVEAFAVAYRVATAPTTRTRPAVAAKNGARRAALAVVRRFAAMIRADPSVDSELRIGLGLHATARTPEGGAVAGSRIPAPSSFPVLTITELARGSHELHINDMNTDGAGHPSGRRSKPRHAMGLVLFRAIADGPVPTPDEARFLALVTRPDCRSAFEPGDNGKTATYFARWANLKGELGPWSPAASMPIAA